MILVRSQKAVPLLVLMMLLCMFEKVSLPQDIDFPLSENCHYEGTSLQCEHSPSGCGSCVVHNHCCWLQRSSGRFLEWIQWMMCMPCWAWLCDALEGILPMSLLLRYLALPQQLLCEFLSCVLQPVSQKIQESNLQHENEQWLKGLLSACGVALLCWSSHRAVIEQ